LLLNKSNGLGSSLTSRRIRKKVRLLVRGRSDWIAAFHSAHKPDWLRYGIWSPIYGNVRRGAHDLKQHLINTGASASHKISDKAADQWTK